MVVEVVDGELPTLQPERYSRTAKLLVARTFLLSNIVLLGDSRCKCGEGVRIAVPCLHNRLPFGRYLARSPMKTRRCERRRVRVLICRSSTSAFWRQPCLLCTLAEVFPAISVHPRERLTLRTESIFRPLESHGNVALGQAEESFPQNATVGEQVRELSVGEKAHFVDYSMDHAGI